jgi:YggT family protein
VVLTLIANVLLFVLTVFLIAMWARFILDWVRLLARRWRPRGVALVLAEASYTVTDPPIRLVRRVVPPLRIGGAALDFAWSIVLLGCLILMAVVRAIG